MEDKLSKNDLFILINGALSQLSYFGFFFKKNKKIDF